MCGIVGYIGNEEVKDVLLKGLERLEYRGYDSSGIATRNDEGILLYKEKGPIKALKAVIDEKATGKMGIGHTRWATHGRATKENAHPHQSSSGRFTLVHNGVIENDDELKETFFQNHSFVSETDSEVIVELIAHFSARGLKTKEAFEKAVSLLEGSYALALIDKEDEGTLYAAKNKSPLLIAVGDSFNGLASDALAMIHETDRFVELFDGEIVALTKDKYQIYDKDGLVERKSFKTEIDEVDSDKGVYDHYMLKEIDEQPTVLRQIIKAYQDEKGQLTIDKSILDAFASAERIYIVACGTSYHAGLVGKEYFEKIASLPTEVHIASEFSYNPPLISQNPLFVFISQSGETADSRAVLKMINELGLPSLTLTNVKGSTLSRESNHTMLLHAGREIAVASTKAYTAQISVLFLLAHACSWKEPDYDLFKELGKTANAMEAVVEKKERFAKIAKGFLTKRNAFFIGRSMDYHLCLEAALKLKEISYIQTEGFAAGELKHGTIALIEEGTPVFALISQTDINANVRGNVKEVEARGANVCIISQENCAEKDDQFVMPHTHPLLTPLVTVIPTQLISYYAALQRKCDVDKPRNLAKSVTVE